MGGKGKGKKTYQIRKVEIKRKTAGISGSGGTLITRRPITVSPRYKGTRRATRR